MHHMLLALNEVSRKLAIDGDQRPHALQGIAIQRLDRGQRSSAVLQKIVGGGDFGVLRHDWLLARKIHV